MCSEVDDGEICHEIENRNGTFSCLFWQNCQENDCTFRSEGFTCERCYDANTDRIADHYFRSSAVCTECLVFPLSIIIAILFLLLIIFGLFRKGVSPSLITQLKILANFVQLLLLTLWMRVDWSFSEDQKSLLTVYTADALNFVNFNFEMFHFDCFFDMQNYIYYLEWFSSTVMPCIYLIIAGVVDYSLHRRIKSGATINDFTVSRRRALRRLMVFLLLVWYVPATQLSLRSYVCESNIPLNDDNTTYHDIVGDVCSNSSYPEVADECDCEDRWLYNGEVCCSHFGMQVITVLSTAVIAVYSIGFPLVLLFFTARAIKFKLLYKYRDLYGGLYESFREKWSFMEAVIILRKLMLILSTDLIPLYPIYLTSVNFAISVVYLIVVIIGRPYSGWELQLQVCSYGVYNFLEIISAEVICVVQFMAILIGAGATSNRAIDYTMLILIILFLMIWTILFLFNILWRINSDDEMEESLVEEISQAGDERQPSWWRRVLRSNKIKDAPVRSEEMERRQKAFEDL